ncbi:hypothetical protein FACS1894172_04350 [Spirochaetia bacterium]|nr:hypothetical protein FACS1894172_04350 [Spirochaetia bacterium]
MLHYYLNLSKGSALDFDTNKIVSEAVMGTARKAFEPFETYLQNVIKTLESKEDIQANWKKVSVENAAELSIIGGLYEIPKRTLIQVSRNKKGCYRIASAVYDPDFSEKVKYKVGTEKGEFEISQDDLNTGIVTVSVEFTKFDKVIWGFNELDLHPAWADFQKGEMLTGNNGAATYKIISVESDDITIEGIPSAGEKLFYQGGEITYTAIPNKQPMSQGVIIRDEPARYVIYSEEKLSGFKEIKRIESFITDLYLENGDELKAERDGLNLKLAKQEDYGKTVITSNKIKFEIKKPQKNNKESYRIQLLEIDDRDNEDDIQTLSPLRYFFDDDVSVSDNQKTDYQIADGRESENTLILKKKNERGYWDFCFPPDGAILKVRANTYQLKKQLEAVSTLKNMPVGEHSRLIRLFENRNDKNVKWDAPTDQTVDEWYVITDETRSGCKEQRDFVSKSLNTPDFAILEGPPGSGKTTVILELICQLAKQGKRVLLCGSTHVAIDNILERLKEKRENKSLLEKFHILPVRIGDEKRINEDIREFQINNLQERASISEALLLDAANLVCGTTMGILQHPQFKKRNNSDYVNNGKKIRNSWIEPIVPEFDYLIIDESSKTTFQEFLVPALYAKKWILAGDVMQLSPFTERENIVSNLEQLMVDGKLLSNDLQYAVFYLQKLKQSLYDNNRFVLPVSAEIIQAIILELGCGRIDDFKNKIFLFIVNTVLQTDVLNILFSKPEETNFLELSAADIIIIDKNVLKNVLPLIPETHAVLLSKDWSGTEHAFRHNAYPRRRTFSYKEKGKEFNDSFEIVDHLNNYFAEKNWAEEVAWRIDREHQLRLIEKSKTKDWYTKGIEELIPKSLDRQKVEDAVNGIAVMAFPSILESLVQGIKGSRKIKTETTISEGFKGDDLAKRKATLVYQHRMHPEISRFPRDRFYKNNALLDLATPPIADARQWGYACYQNRTVWVNVDGETRRNYNEKEVDVLMEHLKKLVQYAKGNPQPEGKEWTVACLSFYRGQESRIREKLQAFCHKENGVSNFDIKDGKHPVNIKLHTVDKFQGHEADVVFLSMVQTKRVGFMDNPNRLNVAITRAKFQLVIFGNYGYFSNQAESEDLKELAKATPKIERI